MKKMVFRASLCIILIFNLVFSTFPIYADTEEPGVSAKGKHMILGTYKDDPILWEVLEDNNGKWLLLSDKILTIKSFDAHASSNYTIDPTYWMWSDLRKWLNAERDVVFPLYSDSENQLSYETEQGFLSYENFSSYEKSLISHSYHDILTEDGMNRSLDSNGVLPEPLVISEQNIPSYVQTVSLKAKSAEDRVFLLGLDELRKKYSPTKKSIQAELTTHAKQELSQISPESDSNKYWVLDPLMKKGLGVYQMYPFDFDPDQAADRFHGFIGVRPAMYIYPSADMIGDGSRDNPYRIDPPPKKLASLTSSITDNLTLEDDQKVPISLTASYKDGSTEDVTAKAQWTLKTANSFLIEPTGITHDGDIAYDELRIGKNDLEANFEGKSISFWINKLQPPPPPQPVSGCSTPGLNLALSRVLGKFEDTGVEGVCNPELYMFDGNQWTDQLDLRARVEFVYKTVSAKGNTDKVFNKYFFENLDYGLYWYNTANSFKKDREQVETTFFDPSKPTVIYVHGYEYNTTKDLFRETGYSADRNTNIWDRWKSEGWNVGVFYWNQFSDELPYNDVLKVPYMAEQKIWNADGEARMRWRTPDGNFQEFDIQGKSASDLFFEAYTEAMKKYTGNGIRVVGHSLGNQMAITMVDKVREAIDQGELDESLLPGRVSLLDPFYSAGDYDFMPDNRFGENYRTGEVAVQMVDKLRSNGVAIDQYQSSFAVDNPFSFLVDPNEDLKSRTAFVHLWPEYNPIWLGAAAVEKNHVVARDWYFMSLTSQPVRSCWVLNLSGWKIPNFTDYKVPTALSTDEDIRQIMREPYKFEQIYGNNNPDPNGCCFGREAYHRE